MDGWDVALLVAAAYVAATALVRLMVRRRDQMLGDLRRQVGKAKHDKEGQQQEPRRKQSA
jgi:hypothetical protein